MSTIIKYAHSKLAFDPRKVVTSLGQLAELTKADKRNIARFGRKGVPAEEDPSAVSSLFGGLLDHMRYAAGMRNKLPGDPRSNVLIDALGSEDYLKDKAREQIPGILAGLYSRKGDKYVKTW